MKNFEMPVVVLNEMTMNESIAVDCCYKQVTEGLVTTKTIVSGGDIGTYTTFPMTAAARNLYGTFANLPAYHAKMYVPKTDLPEIDAASNVIAPIHFTETEILGFYTTGNSVDGYFIDDKGDAKEVKSDTFADGTYFANTVPCDHNKDCYFTDKVELKNAHIGATVRHIFGGANWAQPHVAQQYNS